MTNIGKILDDIRAIKPSNVFLTHLANRLGRVDYRGWHVSQHNRYDIRHVDIMLRRMHYVAGDNWFAIPPGDHGKGATLPPRFEEFQAIVNGINEKMGRGTINSVKKNFFPDLDRMGFLTREKSGNRALSGMLSPTALEFIAHSESDIGKHKIFTDGIDRLFQGKISELAETLILSDYAEDRIYIHEFMFIFSDHRQCLDKIGILDSWRRLTRWQQEKAIRLAQEYAQPENFEGDKTAKRDFHNWKNEAQQIIGLLRNTVYFSVNEDFSFGLNVGRLGIFRERGRRSGSPKRKYFDFHDVEKREDFDLHHIVPLSAARNKKEGKDIDDYRNLIHIHREKHRTITRRDAGGEKAVLSIAPDKAVFSDFESGGGVEVKNGEDALYSRDNEKTQKMEKYNSRLLLSIYGFRKK